MKRKGFFVTTLVVVLFTSAVMSYAYDATGMWSYSEHSAWNNCGDQYIPQSGEVGILQEGTTFLVVNDDFSTYGAVSGNTYSYSDSFCEEGGSTSLNVAITLTSATTGNGTVSWSWSGPGGSCSGGHQFTLNKQPQAAAVYDASGRWNFNQSGFSNNCDSATTPRSSGYFDLTQTDNKITAIDDQGDQHSGFVNGNQYTVVRSYLQQGGRTTDWVIVSLNSATYGTGNGRFVWDDTCDDCGGSWSISVTKETNKTGSAMPWVPLLLLEDQSPPIPPSSISITSLPTTDNDGNYTLQWTVTGLASSPWIIHEDSNTDFASPTTYLSYDNTFPFTHSFTDKSSGTYCYRVGFASGVFSNPACVNVNIPVETRQVTINNQILSGLNLQQVVQVKVSGTNSFSRSDLLTDDPAQCLYLPGEAINRGDSRTFDITLGQNYYLFIGIGIWDQDNYFCHYTHPWFKRRFFTDPSYYTYYVYTIVSVSGHEGGNWDWIISGSYLNGTLVVTPSGNDPIDFTVTQSNPIP